MMHIKSPVYIDANIWVYYFFREDKFFDKVYNIFETIAKEDFIVVSSYLLIEEVWWSIIKNLYKRETNRELNRHRWRKERLKRISNYMPIVKEITQKMFEVTLIPERIPSKDTVIKELKQVLFYIENYIDINDAFHLMYAQNNGVKTFITADKNLAKYASNIKDKLSFDIFLVN